MAKVRLVFVHGAGRGAGTWEEQLSVFPHSEGVTLPGHRLNETLGNDGLRSVGAYARWLRQYLVAERNVDHQTERVVLIGHSMGSAIAMQYALDNPGELAGLGLVGSGSRMRVGAAILDGLLKDYPATVEMIVENSYGPSAKAHLKRATREYMEQLDPQVTLGDFEACNAFDVGSQLGQLAGQPTLIITGQEDRMTPPKYAESLAQNIPGSELHLIQDAGHSVMQEQPEIFNKLLGDFLKQFQ